MTESQIMVTIQSQKNGDCQSQKYFFHEILYIYNVLRVYTYVNFFLQKKFPDFSSVFLLQLGLFNEFLQGGFLLSYFTSSQHFMVYERKKIVPKKKEYASKTTLLVKKVFNSYFLFFLWGGNDLFDILYYSSRVICIIILSTTFVFLSSTLNTFIRNILNQSRPDGRDPVSPSTHYSQHGHTIICICCSSSLGTKTPRQLPWNLDNLSAPGPQHVYLAQSPSHGTPPEPKNINLTNKIVPIFFKNLKILNEILKYLVEPT